MFLLFSDRWIREVLDQEPLLNPEYSHLFLALVFIIGIGYWWVGNDMERHQGIIEPIWDLFNQSPIFEASVEQNKD
jgi:hypothetical protein